MEEAFRALLKALPDLAGVTIDWGDRPRGAPLPGVVLFVVSDLNGHTHDGPDSIRQARIQVDVYAETYGESKQIARTIRGGMDGHSGGIFDAIFLELTQDNAEEGETPDTRVYRCMTDFLVWYQAA